MSTTGAYLTGAGENPHTEAQQVSIVVQVATAAPSVPANIFTGGLQSILGFTINQVWVQWRVDMTAKSRCFIGNSQFLRSGTSYKPRSLLATVGYLMEIGR